jgi:hypothetical protein
MLAQDRQVSNQVSDVSSDAKTSSDLLVNNLVYQQPSALSLATSRSYTRHYPQVQTYSSGQTLVCDLTSGSSFIDPENSYLTFDVQLTTSGGAVTGNFGSGSAMNLIRQTTIRSRSGTELSRTELVNHWSRFHSLNEYTDEYLLKQGPMEGWGDKDRTGTPDTAILSDTAPFRACIPLPRLDPLFSPMTRGQKLPPQLVSGLHIELIFEDVKTAVFWRSGTLIDFSGFTISNIAFVLDSITMTDDVQRVINSESASSGLEVCYDRMFTAQTALAQGATSTSIQIRKAVSQCKYAYTLCLDKSKILSINADSFATVDFDATNWQYRLGSLYFPRQAIQTRGAGDATESYLQQLQMYDRIRSERSSAVSLAKFNTGGEGALCASFERDQNLELSALPVNNSRVAELDITFDPLTPGTLTRQLISFLCYASVSRSFIENTSSSI